ncbi:MAG: hypothetical protein EOO43_08930 [Flavobacterium sp.]|nr:MAG: hypothetical protein EOO43_08930 [Flavobacterium sp.]
MKEEKDIDKLFRDGLESPDIPFDELNWEDMEKMLHPKKKRRIIPNKWYSIATGIAAMLMIALFLIEPKIISSEQLSRKKEIKNLKDITTDSIDRMTVQLKSPIRKKQTNIFFPKPKARSLEIAKLSGLDTTLKVINSLKALTYGHTDLVIKHEPLMLQERPLSPIVASPTELESINVDKRPDIVLGISMAPDLTTVQGSGSSNLSGGLGLEASVFLNKKLSITTGVTYAKKIYDSDFNLYNPDTDYSFRNDPTRVYANCDVLDIPLNVNYKVLENYKGSITISTGFSSYLMLKEKYSYSYHPGIQGPTNYQVNNQNQHLMAIANIGVEFQHKINGKLSLSAKPFVKIPLTNIGYGNAKLSSMGISITANTNLFGRK